MTGYSANYDWNSLIVAPTNMSLSLQKLMEREESMPPLAVLRGSLPR